MQNKFIIDKEINLNECDFLKTKIYADNLTKIIKNSEPNKVFTVGLFGSWGTGKSSIIKTSKQDFDQTKVKFITYDAWQYVNDSFRRMFLRKLREDLIYEETDLMKRFYENESTDVGETYKFNWKNIPISILVLSMLFICAISSIFIVGTDSWKAGLTISAIISFTSLMFAIFQGFFLKLKISVTKPHLFAPEQFEDCFKDIVTNSLKDISWLSKKWNWVIKNDKSIQNLEKLVIVIDNIDRCSNDVAYKLLTDIKTFLSSEKYSIVFIIPVDDAALRKHIINSNKNSDDCDKDKEEFLRKFFNVTIRIKPYGETDMYAFAKQISEQHNLNLKPETINLASKEYAKNPRRVIQLFNNLLAELNYYDAEFIQKNETLICSVLIAREEYPDYYNRVVNSPKLFVDGKDKEDKEELSRFIRISHNAFGKIEIADLSQILTNSHNQFNDLATDVKDAIDTHNDDKILSITETEKEHILDYIIHQLDNSVKNNLIDTELVAYFDLCAKINIKYTLGSHICKKIDEHIIPHIAIIMAKTSNHRNLCIYAFNRNEQGNNLIKSTLIESATRSKDQEKGEHWKPLFSAVLKTFDDKETSNALSSTYTLYPQSNIEYDTFSKEQIEYLISDEFVQQRISELPKNEDNNEIRLVTETEEYETVKWLFENKKNITAETYAILLATIIGEDNFENRMRGKTIDEIADILNFVNPLLNLIPDRKLTTQPQTLYDLIVKNRQMPNPNYRANTYQQPQFINTNFIDECINEGKYISEISDFVINIYRICNNNTSVIAEIGKLLKKKNLDANFLQLINKRYTLNPLLDLIFDGDENYDEKNNFKESDRLALLKHCFNQQNDKKQFVISEEKAKTKLNDLLIFAQKENSNEVFTLLETLSEQERYKKQLADLIVEKDSAFVNSLPQKLLKLAVNSFKKDNCNDFADNFEFLSVIMQNGTKTQKGYVVSILTTKLDNNLDIDNVLSLIETMKEVSSFDANGILHSHLGKYQDDNKDKISEDVNKKVEQLKKKIK